MRLESKYAAAVLAYQVDLGPQLAVGESLTGSPTVSVVSGDVVVEAGASKAGSDVQFRLSGGSSWSDNRILVSCATDRSETIVSEVWVFVV